MSSIVDRDFTVKLWGKEKCIFRTTHWCIFSEEKDVILNDRNIALFDLSKEEGPLEKIQDDNYFRKNLSETNLCLVQIFIPIRCYN
jgi:hypothetical protein